MPDDRGTKDAPVARHLILDDADIDRFLKQEGFKWLQDPNIVGVSVGPKLRGGKPSGELAVIFDVIVKGAPGEISGEGSTLIPPHLWIGDRLLTTDVVETDIESHASAASAVRADPVTGGLSVGNRSENGTLGAVVRHKPTSQAVGLSNWHVLANLGDGTTMQPGPLDVGGGSGSHLGKVIGSGVLDDSVDAAITTIEGRKARNIIAGLGSRLIAVGSPTAGMRVIKYGRSTGTTYGIIEQAKKVIALPVAGRDTRQNILVFVIAPDPAAGSGMQLCDAGDSGACWMLADVNRQSTGTIVGLHVAGDRLNRAYACFAEEVFRKLDIEPLTADAAMASENSADADAIAADPVSPVQTFGVQMAKSVNARGGARLRRGPGTEFGIAKILPFGSTVHPISSTGLWTLVDLEGDGRSDGFVSSALLS